MANWKTSHEKNIYIRNTAPTNIFEQDKSSKARKSHGDERKPPRGAAERRWLCLIPSTSHGPMLPQTALLPFYMDALVRLMAKLRCDKCHRNLKRGTT